VGVIETKEKGGKVGDVLISTKTYETLQNFFLQNDTSYFKISYQEYIMVSKSEILEFLEKKLK
jgi:hypothetical protein